MNSTTKKLVECLEEAEQLISKTSTVNKLDAKIALEYVTDEYKNLSPFKKLANLFTSNRYLSAEPIRLIQHFSCTGGTLFGKCIAAMPNTILLSEISPLSTQLFLSGTSPVFCPTDAISLARISRAPAIDKLCADVFLAEIHVIEKHLRNFGQRLVLREHSHSSFLLGDKPTPNTTISNIVGDTSQLVSIVTVRHPVDSYLSMKNNKWTHYDPATFDEYCRRYLIFLGVNQDTPVFKYENLLDKPESTLQKICDHFDIPYNQDFQDYLEVMNATGNSGRSSNYIGKRDRRPCSEEFLLEVRESSHFIDLCKLLDYEGI